jgi:hypothetical protein
MDSYRNVKRFPQPCEKLRRIVGNSMVPLALRRTRHCDRNYVFSRILLPPEPSRRGR